MKLYETTFNREECLEHYKGYTEMLGERFALKEPGFNGPELAGNHLLFAYEYDKRGAEIGLSKIDVCNALSLTYIKPKVMTETFGGYVNSEGAIIEEHGYLLTFDEKLSPVSLGALAHKIADMFRQESVLAIYESEVTFVYA